MSAEPRHPRLPSWAGRGCGGAGTGGDRRPGEHPGDALPVGVVEGPRGPETGVWVIAETDGLPTKVRKIVVTVVDGIARVLFFIGEKVFEAVIKYAQQALDFIEGVWNWLKVKLEQLYEWLAFLFNFKDFARTAEGAAYVLIPPALAAEHLYDLLRDPEPDAIERARNVQARELFDRE